MFPVSDGFGPFLLPPPRFSQVPCFPEHLARILSLFVLNASSPSVSVYSADPLQCLFIHRPSIGKIPTLQLTADQCPLLVSSPASHMQVCAPPPTCAAGGTWLGYGWRGEGDAPPAMVLSPSTRHPASPKLACLRQRSSSLFNSCGARLSVSPPSPFPRTTLCVPILSLLTEEYFRGRSAHHCPAGPVRPVGCIHVSGPRPCPPPPPLPIPWPSSLGRVVP